MKADTYSVAGKKASAQTTLPGSVFGEKDGSVTTIKQVLEAYQANGRSVNSNTKTRGLVRGGGKKPWKQKGTGRARVGSIRSPLWRGGGITFGPLGERNFTKKVNSKMRKSAIRQSLTMKAADKKIVVVKDLAKLDGKTKSLADLLKGVGADRRTVLLAENVSPEMKKSASNIVNTTVKQASYVNINDAVNSDMIIVDDKALPALEAALKGGK